MSKTMFPTLSLAYDLVLTPQYNTRIATSINGTELRANLQAQPKYEISLSLPVMSERLDENEYTRLSKFFSEQRGSFKAFYFSMPDDNFINLEVEGPGSEFYIMKGDIEIVHTDKLKGPKSPLMWQSNDSLMMWNSKDSAKMWTYHFDYTLEDGKLTVYPPLMLNEKYTIGVNYYYKCRFAEDAQQFTQFTYKLWRGDVSLVGTLGKHI